MIIKFLVEYLKLAKNQLQNYIKNKSRLKVFRMLEYKHQSTTKALCEKKFEIFIHQDLQLE